MNKKALLTSSLAVLLVVSPATSFAASNNQTTSTTSTTTTTTNQTLAPMSVASVSPADTSTEVRPDAPITVVLGANEKTTPFEKGRYQVTINGQQVSSTYDTGSKTITIPHAVFTRYSTYTVTITTSQEFFAFSFKTGSEIGEATHLSISPEQTQVRTTDTGKIDVAVSDDYGNPAQNALVKVTSDSTNLSATSLSITPQSNGKGVIALTDHKKEVANLTVTSNDGTYRDAVDTQQAGSTMDFLAGHPAKAVLLTNSVQAGKTSNVQFQVSDTYGNPVENDEVLYLAPQSYSTIQASSVNGVVSFPFAAPTNVQNINVVFSAASNGYVYMPSPLQVVPAEAAKATISLSSGQTLKAGDTIDAKGQLTDQYGNFIANKQISFGSLGTATTDSNGNYDFSFTVPNNLTEIGLQVDGNPISVIDANGATVTTLPVRIAQKVTLFDDFEAGSNVFNITGDWYRSYSSNGTYALMSGYPYYSTSSQFTVNVPDNAIDATLSLDYMSDNYYGILYIYIDGQMVVDQYGSSSWNNLTHTLTPGSHTVQVVHSPYYYWDYSGYSYIDNINLTYYQ